jgi:hypothetical protein
MLRYTLEEMPAKTWLECFKDTVNNVNQTDGVAHIKNKETLSCWHLAFQRNNKAFPNPHIYSIDGKNTSLPPPLDCNQELARCTFQYTKQNMNELSAELLYYSYVLARLPALLKERQAELADKTYTMEQLHHENRLTMVSISTIFRWRR